ncbi:MAG: 23S rRNA (guanosine(2251)-2'-O)-methyltransferase RlmB [Acidimicrobiales bacterium]
MEGRRAVAELLVAGRRPVLDIWMARGLKPAPALDEIAKSAERARVPLRMVSREQLAAEAASHAPQGVLAHAHPLPEADLDDLLAGSGSAEESQATFLVAVDGVTDPQNLGALLRSAEAAGVSGAILPRHRSTHVTPAVTKAAAGAVERVPMALVAGMPAALARARERGCWVIGLAGDGSQSLFGLDPGLTSQPVVVVVGAEGTGLSRLARQRCDVVVRIPMEGAISSLNVAVAGAMALFEVRRQRQGAH